MSIVDKKLVRRIAELSQLSLTDEEVDHYELQLSKIVDYVKQLDTAEWDHEEMRSQEESFLRPDIVVASLDVQKSMQLAPRKIGTAFQVPRILE